MPPDTQIPDVVPQPASGRRAAHPGLLAGPVGAADGCAQGHVRPCAGDRRRPRHRRRGTAQRQSALRSGAGMVSLATRGVHVAPALARLPEVMVADIARPIRLLPMAEAASVLVVGPGLGQAGWGRSLLSVAASQDKPQVVGRRCAEPVGPRRRHAARRCGTDPASWRSGAAAGHFYPAGAGRSPAAARRLARQYAAVCVSRAPAA